MLALTHGDESMGLTHQEQLQQNEMQKDIKRLVEAAGVSNTRLSVLEDRVNSLLGDKKRAVGFILIILTAAVTGLAGWIWTLITTVKTPHP